MGWTTIVKQKVNNFNIKNVVNNALILDQLIKYMKKDVIKQFLFCSKKMYSFYCTQIQKLNFKDIDNSIIFKRITNKYTNIKELFLENIELNNYEFIYNFNNLKKYI